MAKYDGVVTLADGDIPVNVALENGHVRMSSAGTEIGQWSTEDCLIEARGDETFTISAEDEILRFVPDEPEQFAAAVMERTERTQPERTEPAEIRPADDGIIEAPPPKPLTMVGFYALCVITAALAVWSLITLII